MLRSCRWRIGGGTPPRMSDNASQFRCSVFVTKNQAIWTSQGCLALLNTTDCYQWTRSLTARPDKCFSVSLRLFNAGSARETSQYRSYDPSLTIAGKHLQYLGSDNFKYLGRPINCDLSEHLNRQSIMSYLSSMLDKLEAAALSAPAKLWLNQHFVTAKLA